MVRSDGQLGFLNAEMRLSALSKASDPLGTIAALVPCESLRIKFFELARPTSEAANRDCP